MHLTALSKESNDGLSSLICHACVRMALSSRMCCAAEAHVVRHILRHRCKRKLQTALRYDRHVRYGCKSCCLLHLPRCALNNRAVRCVWRAHVNVKTSHECAAESRVLTKHADTHTHTICAVCLSPCNIMFWNLLYHATHHNISCMKQYAFRSALFATDFSDNRAGMEIILTDGCHFQKFRMPDIL